MTVLRPRKRLIYVRISEDEFQRFTHLCQMEGVRSMSDLMRAALERLMAEKSADPNRQDAALLRVIGDTVSQVNEKVGHLTSMLDHLYHQDGALPAPAVRRGDPDSPEGAEPSQTARLNGGSANLSVKIGES